jgi:hypothetical protein
MLGWILKWCAFSQSPVYRALPMMSMKDAEIAARDGHERAESIIVKSKEKAAAGMGLPFRIE